jgi:hypothetical protein
MAGRWGVILAAALALSAVTGWQGYRLGTERAEARHLAEQAETRRRLAAATAEANRREAARLAAEAARDAMVQDLEEAARADRDADRPALSADSVRRLSAR